MRRRLTLTLRAIACGITVCACVAGIVSGCGYTTRSLIADKYHTIYIPAFKNKINIAGETTANNYRLYRPKLETDITSSVIQNYLTDGTLKPVKQKDGADLMLEGNLVDFRKDALTYARSDYVNEYRVTITVGLKLTVPSTGAVVWEEPSYAGSSSYVLTGAQAATESTAISTAISDLSRRIIERTVDQW